MTRYADRYEATESRPPSRPPRRWFQLTLRTALVVLTLACIWLGILMKRARDERAAVARIEQLGGRIHYDWEYEYVSAARRGRMPTDLVGRGAGASAPSSFRRCMTSDSASLVDRRRLAALIASCSASECCRSRYPPTSRMPDSASCDLGGCSISTCTTAKSPTKESSTSENATAIEIANPDGNGRRRQNGSTGERVSTTPVPRSVPRRGSRRRESLTSPNFATFATFPSAIPSWTMPRWIRLYRWRLVILHWTSREHKSRFVDCRGWRRPFQAGSCTIMLTTRIATSGLRPSERRTMPSRYSFADYSPEWPLEFARSRAAQSIARR